MVLGKLPVPGRPTIWITVGQGPTALAVGVGGGCLDIFTLIYPFSPLSTNNLSLHLCISRMFTEFSSYTCPVEQSQWKVCLFRNIPYNVG